MTTAVRRARRPEPSQRSQRILTIVLAVAILGIVAALILADRAAPRTPLPDQPIQQTIP